MRIFALLGLGLPVLAVSGAVAYGSIREISRSFSPAPVAQTIVAPAGPSSKALAFVAAGQAEWDMPQNATFMAPGFQDTGIDTAAPTGLASPDNAPDRPREFDHESNEATAVALVPTVRSAPPKPRVIVTATRSAARPQATTQARAKRPFKMPWQTGIFQ